MNGLGYLSNTCLSAAANKFPRVIFSTKLKKYSMGVFLACGLGLSQLAMAAVNCTSLAGPSSVTFSPTSSSFDIRSLPVGAIITTVAANSNATSTVSCPAATVQGALLPTGGLVTTIRNKNVYQTSVAGVGMTFNSSVFDPYPIPNVAAGSTTFSNGTTQTLQFVKTAAGGSAGTNNTINAGTLVDNAFGDNKVIMMHYVLGNAVSFIRSTTTCAVTAGSANQIVRLSTLTQSRVNISPETVAGSFNIGVNCPANTETAYSSVKAAIGFSVSAGDDGTKTFISNMGTAAGVGLRVRNTTAGHTGLLSNGGSTFIGTWDTAAQFLNPGFDVSYAKLSSAAQIGVGTVLGQMVFTLIYP